MKYIIIGTIGLVLSITPCLAQKKTESKYKSISSRNLRLDQSVPDLLKEAQDLMRSDTRAALDRVEEALAQSLTENSRFNEASCYLMLGKINHNIEEWELAIENYTRAFELLQKGHSLTPEFRETLGGLAETNSSMGNYALALEYLQVKLRAATTPMERARTQLAIVEAHLQLEHYQEASVSLQQAEESILNNELSSLDGIARALKVKLLAEQGEVEAAEQIYQEGQSLDFAIDDEESGAFMEESKEAIISAYTKQNRVEEGIALRNQAIESNLAKGAPRKVLIDKKALGKTLIEIGETSAAIRQLEDAAALSDSLGDDEEQAAAYLALGEAWYSTGNALKAVDAYRKYGEAMERVRMKDSKLQQVKGEVLKRQQEILALSKDLKLDESQYELEMNQLRFQRLVIYGLMGLLVIAIVVTWVIHRNAMKSKRMSQLLALKSLRSQMNPHFIFNALNSVNQFIALQDELAANKFLSEFSKLMRLVLDNSQQDFISLGEEREFLELYLKLEHYRFRDKFDYSLMIDDSLDLDSIDIPPLLIQPYIENAIWHGLRYKEGKGSLEVAIKPEGEGILVEIKDDGIGRRQSAALKTDQQKKHQSTGLKNTEQRLLILNKVYHKRYSVQVSDLSEDQTGTRVVLILPSNGKV